MRRVVVSGMGIVSSIGNNTQEVLASLREARSGHRLRRALQGARLPLPGARRAAARPGRRARPPRHALPRRRHRLEPHRHGAGDPRFRAWRTDEVSNERTGIIMGSGGPSTRTIVEAADMTREKGREAGRPVRRAEGDVLDRLGDARHLVQDQGRELFDLLGLRDLQPLHRQRLRDHPARQAGRDVRRRLRGARLDAVGAVRRHGRDVDRLQRHARTRPRAPTTRSATASSSPAAPAWWCWRSSSTPRRAAPRSTARSSATAPPPTASTWCSRRAKARRAA